MDKLKIAQFIFGVFFMIVFVFRCCDSNTEECDINNENRQKLISGTVIKKYKDPKDHNHIKLILNNKAIIYGYQEYTNLGMLVEVGDSLYKPFGSLIVAQFRNTDTVFQSFDISLKCDTVKK